MGDRAGDDRQRTVVADRRMTDVEALMWNVDKDPYLTTTFGSLTLLDRPPDRDRLRKRMAYTVSCIPRLRQRVQPALGRLAPPEWVDDPEFDLDYHIRWIGLPQPGSTRQLFDLAPLLVQDPFDRTRPLWEFFVIEGLEGGRAAMLQKLHHTITDGEGGIRMSERFVDLTREADDPEPVANEEATPLTPNLIETSLETIGHGVRRGLGAAQRTAADAFETVTDPARLVAMPNDVVETGRSVTRQLLVTDAARSPLWRHRTLRRHLEVLDVPFDDAKHAAKSLGGSLNDFFVAGAAAAAGDYHRQQDQPVAELRMAMPVSTRTGGTAGGNSFAPTRVVVPTTGPSPAEHFARIHECLTATKGERAIGLMSGLAGLLNVLPTSVLARFGRQQMETIDFTTSNVRAAPFDLYIAGSLVEANYPLGPVGGTAFNLTMMSYRASLHLGVHIDGGAVADPELLRSCLERSYAELIAAGS